MYVGTFFELSSQTMVASRKGGPSSDAALTVGKMETEIGNQGFGARGWGPLDSVQRKGW